MITYQGSKQRYAADIQRALQSFGTDYWNLPFVEGCCGSAAVSAYIGKPVTLIDMGPWGRFWEAVKEFSLDIAGGPVNRLLDYEGWVRYAVEVPVPVSPIEFAYTFLALQREAFRGKPVGIMGNQWVHPGFRDSFSEKKWRAGLLETRRVKIVEASRDNLNHKTLNISNIYIDPDYENTTGYNDRTLDIKSFVRRHTHCNLIVSHHTEIPDVEWDEVRIITQKGRQNSAKDNSERLHIKRRKA